jgi:hypothetical protein
MHLTYPTESGPNVEPRPRRRTKAGAPEIEITPEMIEAGVAEFGRYDSRFGRPTEAVERIFMAMLSARTAARNS